jgi:hypothetical protein
MDTQAYTALWYLWTSQGTRTYIADQLNFSGPTIKRRWNNSINLVLLMLLFPTLMPEHFSLNSEKRRAVVEEDFSDFEVEWR